MMPSFRNQAGDFHCKDIINGSKWVNDSRFTNPFPNPHKLLQFKGKKFYLTGPDRTGLNNFFKSFCEITSKKHITFLADEKLYSSKKKKKKKKKRVNYKESKSIKFNFY